MSSNVSDWTDDREDDEEDETVSFAAKMPRRLREDAKRNTGHGELTEEIRNLFRRFAYGPEAGQETSELDRLEAQLQEVRQHLDSLRYDRRQVDIEIETYETRATRLEEKVSALERRRSELDTKTETLETMLHNGDRWWPKRIMNSINVDRSTAEKIHRELKERNPELPEDAFKVPAVHQEFDWKSSLDWQEPTGDGGEDD